MFCKAFVNVKFAIDVHELMRFLNTVLIQLIAVVFTTKRAHLLHHLLDLLEIAGTEESPMCCIVTTNRWKFSQVLCRDDHRDTPMTSLTSEVIYQGIVFWDRTDHIVQDYEGHTTLML